MAYPPEMMNSMPGMAAPYSPKGAIHSKDPRQAFPNYPTYHDNSVYQVPSPQAGYLPNTYPQAPYATTNSMYQQPQPLPNTPSQFPQRSSGVAVVIPSPSQPHMHRTPSMPTVRHQPTKTTQRNVSTPAAVPKPSAPAPATLQLPSTDYQNLLISLAEDYLAAAYSQASLRTSKDRENSMRLYYKLIATGLACFETLLKKFKLQPQMEASLRLRYASVLYEETENMLEAEQCLSDGIKLCDRYRLFDLKYNMEHLLARVLFKGSPRAALKFLDRVIQDAEAYRHTVWVYALRFLKVSLLLQLSSHQDILSAFSQLKSISAVADQSGDKAILAVVSTLEALVHLRDSSSAESIEQAQRAVALARSLQHDPVVGQISQLAVLTNIADLSCSLQQHDRTQAVIKMEAMQALLESPRDSWHEDGSFLTPVPSQDALRSPNGDGIVQKDSKGVLSVIFHWAPWTDVYALGYLLSSISISHRNTSDGLRSEQMLKEGMRFLDKNTMKTDSVRESISTTASGHTWRQTLRCFFQLHLVFALCTRTAWKDVQDELQKLKDTASSIIYKSEILDIFIQYLEGIIAQGTGHLDAALSIFQRPCFSLTRKLSSPIHLDLSILSTFNSILILRSSSHPIHHTLTDLLSSLTPHLPRIHSTKPLLSAYNIILATTPNPAPPTIVRTKQYLQSALKAAKSCSNNQLMCITLNFMSFKFFKGVVGEQAEKSARASENLARKGGDGLWRSVSAGVVGESLELAGREEEAEKMREIGRDIARGLAEGIVRWEDVEGGASEGMK